MTDTMKLYAFDNSDLMEITKIYPDGNNLVIEGFIMGAMPLGWYGGDRQTRGSAKSVKTHDRQD